MNSTIIIGVVISLVVGAAVALYYYRKKSIENLFNQTFEMAKQVPKQKKNSFLLLMFKESLSAAKNKKKKKSSFESKLSNPKYLEIQLVQMSHILKNTDKVQDKTMKRSLNLLKDYQAWEKAKIAKNKKEALEKAS